MNFVPEYQHLGSNPRLASAKKPLLGVLEEPFSDRFRSFYHNQQVARVQVNFVPEYHHLGSNTRAATAKKLLFDMLAEAFTFSTFLTPSAGSTCPGELRHGTSVSWVQSPRGQRQKTAFR